MAVHDTYPTKSTRIFSEQRPYWHAQFNQSLKGCSQQLRSRLTSHPTHEVPIALPRRPQVRQWIAWMK